VFHNVAEAHPSSLGPYKLESPLGAGGMGEVYRARDTRLQRDVALKILPKAFAADADRRRRFLQEAQAAGALNHPNILSIYDAQLEGDTPYLVTELLDGRTLREQIDRGAVPLSRALDLAAQIAAGLQAAHGVGIVHRDLKPENVMVTRDGRAKILDFGLAKTTDLSGTGATQTQTEAGLVLGTVPYMSPQQARGEPVDFRSDQFAFGLVLYEMVGGTHPFRREASVQTMSAIIAEEARPIGEVNPNTPVPLRWIIERCLAKDPAARYASTADLARDLATLNTRVAEVAPDLAARAPRSRRDTLRWAVTLTALAAAIATTLWTASRPVANPLEGYKYSPLVTGAPFQSAPAWSPDGKSLAYVSQVDGVIQVFTRSLASSSRPAQLTQSLFDCTDPFWSADGSRIYFHRQAEDTQGLWAVSAAAGEPQLIRRNVVRATISTDDQTLVFFERVGRGDTFGLRLMAASPLDGEAQRLQLGDSAADVVDGWLRFSPDGRKLLVWAYPGLYVNSRERINPFWVIDWPARTSHGAFASVAARTLSGAMAFSWMPDSRHVVLSLGDPGTAAQHLWMGDTERDLLWPISSTTATESYPVVSHDGRRLAFTSEAVDFDLVALPLDGGPPRTLLATSRNEYDPAWWQPQGTSTAQAQLVFVTDRSGTLELWVRSAADSQFAYPVVTADTFPDDTTLAIGAIAISPNGTQVAYQRLGERAGYDVWLSTMAAAGPPVPVVAGASTTGLGLSVSDAPTWSPAGDWLALRHQGKVVKRRVGSNADSVVLASDPVEFARLDWSPDGKAIVYMSSEGLAVVPADGGPSRVISEAPWFSYVWSSDSRRVIGVREASTARHLMLADIDPATGRERILNPDLGVIPPANQPIRGLARMGPNAVVTSIARARSDIWMLEGFAPARARFSLGWLRKGP